MKYAYLILRIIPSNPCEGAQIFTAREKAERKNKKNKKIKFMPLNKIKPFLDQAAKLDYIYYIFFKFLIETGCRKGEAMALQWSDIDFDMHTIDINKTINYFAKTDEDVFGDTKTYSSQRKIKFPQKLAEDLMEYQGYQRINEKRLQEKYHSNLNLVFCRIDGRPLPKSTLYRAFNDLLNKSGIDKIPIHALRHTHATLALEAGRNKESVLKDLSERLGHSSIEVTDKIYTDLTDVIRNDDIDEFEKYIDKYL